MPHRQLNYQTHELILKRCSACFHSDGARLPEPPNQLAAAEKILFAIENITLPDTLPLMKKTQTGRPPHLKTIFRKFDPPLYFITLCTHNRRSILANDPFHDHFIAFMKRKCEQGICCGEYVIMPDHIHLFLRIDAHQHQLGRTIGFIKKSLSKPLNEIGVEMPHWQPDFFDHILRSADSYSEKWDYVRENPVRAGLTKEFTDWKYQGTIVPIRY